MGWKTAFDILGGNSPGNEFLLNILVSLDSLERALSNGIKLILCILNLRPNMAPSLYPIFSDF